MANPKSSRDAVHERNLAHRIQRERERRGLSYEALAKAVTQAGCLMHPSTPFKIEKGDPPRRITIDEFVAFSKVFDLSLDELLVAPEVAAEVEAARVKTLLARYVAVLLEQPEPQDQLSAIVAELSSLLGGVEQAAQALLAHAEARVLAESDPAGRRQPLPE